MELQKQFPRTERHRGPELDGGKRRDVRNAKASLLDPVTPGMVSASLGKL